MADAGSIRALLIEGDAASAVLTRNMLDEASDGLVDLVHIEQLGHAIDRLGRNDHPRRGAGVPRGGCPAGAACGQGPRAL